MRREGEDLAAPLARGKAQAFSELYTSGPTLINHIVRLVLRDRGLAALEALLATASPSAEAGGDIRSMLETVDVRGGLRTAFLGERCFGHAVFSRAEDDRSLLSGIEAVDSMETGALSGLYRILPSPVLRLDHAFYLRLMGRAVALAEKPFHETRGDWQALVAEANDPPWYGILSGLTLVQLAPVVSRSEAHRARVDLARLALAIDAGERPEIPLDPFRGETYVYRETEGGGFLLASVGPDGKDEGGAEGGDDIVWRRPAR